MLKMLLNDLLKDIDHYLIMRFELVLVYDDLLVINYLNLILMMAMLNILEGIQLHLINQEDELEKKIIRDLFSGILIS
jgi:glucose uptake protein GlcU